MIRSVFCGLLLAIVGCVASAHEGLEGGGFSENVPSSVCIVKVSEIPLRDGSSVYFGSGTFLSDRLVLTAYHNVRDFVQRPSVHKLQVLTKRGNVLSDVKVVKSDSNSDLCLLLTEPGDVHLNEFVTSDSIIPTDLIAYGFDPSKMKVVRYDGKYAPEAPKLTYRGASGPVWFQHRVKTVQGMSGGPILGKDSREIVGVIMGTTAGRDGLSQATVPKVVQEFVDSYRGEIGRIR